MARCVLQGAPISPGIAIGELHIVSSMQIYEKRNISDEEIESEINALTVACWKVCQGLEETMCSVPANLAEYREIIGAQMELARDPRIIKSASARIRHRKICAAWALSETIDELCALFQGMTDPYLHDRAQDIKIIGQCLGDCLAGGKKAVKKSRGILAANDLSASDAMEFILSGIEGIITIEGGPTTHTAILARGLKIPAITGVADIFIKAEQGEKVIVDGLSGLALLDPDEADIAHYESIKQSYGAFESVAREYAALPAITKDDNIISVMANVENTAELAAYNKSGAEGIGLYRTEFAFVNKMPTEEELIAEYKTVLKNAGQKLVVFRTLDLGADKIFQNREILHEPNPALGLRGIRFCLHNRDIFLLQIRALLQACNGAKAAIMLPMVSTLSEIQETRYLFQQTAHELRAKSVPHAERLPLGIMVETPAAVVACDILAGQCDFLSIGTNDLLHYIMAIDRNNRHVAYLHEPLHPAFTRSLKRIIDTGHQAGLKVSVCGELATDPFGIVLLLGMGIDTFSAAPRFVPGIKQILRQLDAKDCQELAKIALNEINIYKTGSLLRKLLQNALGKDLNFHNSFIINENEQKENDGRHCDK